MTVPGGLPGTGSQPRPTSTATPAPGNPQPQPSPTRSILTPTAPVRILTPSPTPTATGTATAEPTPTRPSATATPIGTPTASPRPPVDTGETGQPPPAPPSFDARPTPPPFDPRICGGGPNSPSDLCREESLPGAEPPSEGFVIDVRPATPTPPAAAPSDTTADSPTDTRAASPAAETEPAAAASADPEAAPTTEASPRLGLDRGTGATYSAGDTLTITYSVPEPMPVEVAIVLADRRLVLYQGTVQASSTLTAVVPATSGLAVVELQATGADGATISVSEWFRVP